MRNRDPKKKQKGQESTIGKIIYGFLLFLPLLAIGVTCLVSTFNMNAKNETTLTYKYKSNDVSSIDDLIEDNIYKLDTSNLTNYVLSYNDLIICNSVFVNNETFDTQTNNNDNSYLVVSYDNNYGLIVISLYVNNAYNKQLYTLDNNTINDLNFVYRSITTFTPTIISNIEETDFNVILGYESTNLDAQQVFYKSIDKVQQSPLFNWAENSIIYTTTATTCNALSITTPFIPLLMSYWLIISVIYFLYDIALMLVWIIHRKIHELQESI